MKLTGWYKNHQKPIRSGWYHVSSGRGEVFYRLFWNVKNQQWGVFDCGHWYASPHQEWEWRGMKK